MLHTCNKHISQPTESQGCNKVSADMAERATGVCPLAQFLRVPVRAEELDTLIDLLLLLQKGIYSQNSHIT